MWWVADLQARKLARVSVSWFHSGAASSMGLKLLDCVGDRWGMHGVGGVRVVGSVGATSDLNIGGGFLVVAKEHARNGSVTGVVAMVTCCCCGQVSTFKGRRWVLSGTEATMRWSEIELTTTTKKWEVASEFVDGKTVEL